MPVSPRPADDPGRLRRRKPPISDPPIPGSVQMLPPVLAPASVSIWLTCVLAWAARPVWSFAALTCRLPPPSPHPAPSPCVDVSPWEASEVGRGSAPLRLESGRTGRLWCNWGEKVSYSVASGNHVRSAAGALASGWSRRWGRRAGRWTKPGRETGQEGSALTVRPGAEVSDRHPSHFLTDVCRRGPRPSAIRVPR